MTHPYFSLEHPARLAHRGSRLLWPENTMTAFGGAVEGFGYRYLETDVRATRDGVLVTFHDETLDRITNGVGRVADWLWDDLRHLDAAWGFGASDDFPLRGTGVRIPRLDEVFATWPEVNVNIDLKADGIEWAVAEAVIRSRRVQKVLIGSFRDRRIARFRRVTRGAVATSAGTAVSMAAWAASRTGRRLPSRPDAYQLPFAMRGARLDKRFVDAAHACGSQVHAWTVNERTDMERLLDIGVDGIVTDRPDVLNDVMTARAGDG
jgi:glycerophosphoryl diester phosphodiesterase